jgi:hypothetical protein
VFNLTQTEIKKIVYGKKSHVNIRNLDIVISYLVKRNNLVFCNERLSDRAMEEIETKSYFSLLNLLEDYPLIPISFVWREVHCDFQNYLNKKENKYHHIQFEENRMPSLQKNQEDIQIIKSAFKHCERLNPVVFKVLLSVYNEDITIDEACKKNNISPRTFYRKKNEMEVE